MNETNRRHIRTLVDAATTVVTVVTLWVALAIIIAGVYISFEGSSSDLSPLENSLQHNHQPFWNKTATMEKVQQILGSVASGGSKLPTAKLGKNGPQVTRLGYGTMGLVSTSTSMPLQ